MGKFIDMTGWKMWEHGVPDSRLTVLERASTNGLENKPQWKCRCNCGTELIVLGKSLRNGNTKSCGCLQKDWAYKHAKSMKKDLVGQKFGYLTVLEDTGKYQGHNTIWKCICECGNICYVSGSNLGRSIISCGCSKMSGGEKNILDFLIENHYNFIHDKIYFKDLLSVKGYPCRYDFIILDEQNAPYWIIEFDGKQHSNKNAMPHFYDEASFLELQQNDIRKNQYAIEHNIPLVRIPYEMKNKITKELLFGSQFLLSEFKT